MSAVIVAGKGCARFGLVRRSVLGYAQGAAALGLSAGFERASRRIICHTVGGCLVVDTTTVLPIVAGSSASVSR